MGDCAFVVFNTSIITGKAVLCFLFFFFACMRVDTIMCSVFVCFICIYVACLYRKMYSQILRKWVSCLSRALTVFATCLPRLRGLTEGKPQSAITLKASWRRALSYCLFSGRARKYNFALPEDSRLGFDPSERVRVKFCHYATNTYNVMLVKMKCF